MNYESGLDSNRRKKHVTHTNMKQNGKRFNKKKNHIDVICKEFVA